MTNQHRRDTVILSAWVTPALRDYAREEAKLAGVSFSEFIERAVQQAVSKALSKRAARAALERGLTPSRRRIK